MHLVQFPVLAVLGSVCALAIAALYHLLNSPNNFFLFLFKLGEKGNMAEKLQEPFKIFSCKVG